MKSVIPAAGLGTRFYPLTKYLPKEFLPIGNKPAIDYLIQESISAGITDIIIILNKNKKIIKKYLTSEYPQLDFTFVYQEKQNGLGAALLCAEQALENEDMFIMLGDCVANGDIYNHLFGQIMLCAVRVSDEEAKKSGVIVGDRKGQIIDVVDLVEKPQNPPSNYAIYGRYKLPYRIIEILKETPAGANGEIQLTDAIKTLAQETKVRAFILNKEQCLDIGRPQSWLEANICLEATSTPQVAK